MPNSLGTVTKTLFLKQENHKLSEEFEVKEAISTLTGSIDLVASNSTIITVNGNATTATVFATDHDTTMAAIAVKVAALPGVKSCTASGRIFTVIMDDQTVSPVISGVTTAGATQPTWTAAYDINTVYPGMSVKLTTDGKIEPAAANENLMNIIGYAIHQGYGYELVTVFMRAQVEVFAEAYTTNHTAAPVKYSAFNTLTSRCQYDDASVTHENYVGWSLDAATAAGDEIRVALL